MFDSGFANVRHQKGAGIDYEGYQVTFLSRSSDYVSASRPGALKEILKRRNECYRESGQLHTSLMRKYAEGGVTESEDSNGDGKRVPCFRVQLRNLETGKPAQRIVRFKLAKTPKSAKVKPRVARKNSAPVPSKRQALLKAKALSAANLEAYNAMEDSFNELVFEAGIKLAESEVRTLKPKLNKLKKLEEKRWAGVFAQHFPDGLTNPVDPSQEAAL